MAPGNSIGTLSVNNNLALAGVSSFEVTGGSGPFASADKAANIAALTYGGTLKIIKLGGTLAAGDSWDLFDFASQSGTFANNSVFETAGDGVNLPVLGTKLIWQFSYATGILAVVSLIPTVSSITPAIGPTTGGVLVTIIGSSFISISSVTFGGVAAASFSVTGTTQINAIAPPKSGLLPGTVDVVVGNYAATGSLVGGSDFTYARPAVTSVVINGGPDVVVAGATVGLAGQHSIVKQILVEFNQAVTVAPDAFTVTPRANNVTVRSGAAPSTLAVTTSVAPLSPSEYLVTFSGPGTHSGVLNSGVFDLTALAGKVTANGDSMASNRVDTFFAMFGTIDANNSYTAGTIGNGGSNAFVDPGSLFRFSDSFGSNAATPVGPPAYNIIFDSNLDGYIDPGDLFAFSDSFGIDWNF